MVLSIIVKALQIFSDRYGLLLLRYSLGITFLWFGVLKLIGMSPVADIILSAVPAVLSTQPFFFFSLALLEIFIGLGLLFRRTAPVAAIIMMLHLLVATGSVLLTQGFAPSFPLLTLPGEFVVKNLILIAAGFVIIRKDR